MKIDDSRTQEIVGDFINAKGETLEKNVKCRVKFNRYSPMDTLLSTEDLPGTLMRSPEEINFREPDGTTYFIDKSLSTELLNSAEFYVQRLDTKEQNVSDSYVYSSGCVANLLYYGDMRSKNIEIAQRRVPEEVSENTKYFYEIRSQSALGVDDVDDLFLMIATITGSKFFCRSAQSPSGELTYYAKWALDRRLTIYGSGRTMFPVEMDQLITIKSKVPLQFFRDTLLLYTDFCTTKGPFEQLVKGCSVLDYFVETHILSKGQERDRRGKSQKMFEFIDFITTNDSSLRTYAENLFRDYPKDASFLGRKKFEFLERRDAHLHRGIYLSETEQARNLLHNVFVVNELLRVAILHLPQIPYKELSPYDEVIHVSDMQNSIRLRNELMRAR